MSKPLCTFLLVYCKGCNRKFRRDERYLECPDCGTPRKCRSWAVRGTKLCAKHGGKANPKAKYTPNRGKAIMTGKSSSSLVANLASKYLDIRKSGPYQTNKASVDVLDVRIQQLLTRIDHNESPKRLENIINAWEKIKTAIPGMRVWLKDKPEGLKAFNALEDEIEKAYHDYESWKQIMQVFDLRRKVTKDEMSILKDMKALISAEDAYELAGQLLAAVLLVMEGEPNGSKLVKAIHSEFARILGEPYIDPSGRRGTEIIDLDTSGLVRD